MDHHHQAKAVLKLHERRDGHAGRVLGHLVSLNGMHAIIATHVGGVDNTNSWSIGHLVTIVQGAARLVGVVCELTAAGHAWSDGDDGNIAHVKIELAGEILDDERGQPVFYRGMRNYPELGAIAHRIRTRDLAAIYAFRGRQGVEIGRLSQAPTIPAVISVEELLTRHFAVIGSTGVGKTTAVAGLVSRSLAQRENLRVLILDPHNEYAAHFGETAAILDSDTLEIPFWMFRFEELLDIIYAGRKPTSDEADALYDLIKSAKARFAVTMPPPVAPPQGNLLRRLSPQAVDAANISADTPTPYRMADAIKIIDEWTGQLERRFSVADLRALRARLELLARDPRFRFMFSKGLVEDNMARILSGVFRVPDDGKRVTIVQLAGLPNEVVNSVVSVLARLAFEIAVWSRGGFEIALVCEEAHRYIPNDRSLGFLPTRQAIGRIAKEGRKYGACLAVVSQRPSELDSTVLSQCSTMFAMRLPNDADKAIIRAALGESSASIISFLSSIADREAIAFGEAIPTPMRMKFADAERRATREEERQAAPPIGPHDLARVIARLRGEGAAELG